MAGHLFSLEPQIVPKVSTRHRSIQTAIPAPGTAELVARLQAVESRSMHGQLPLVWERAEDAAVYDPAGNRWIDFTSTIFVANVGHSNARVSAAMRKTLDSPLYSTYAYINTLRADYLERLLRFAGKPFEKAFLLSAGTEATEAALKLMRMNGQRLSKRRCGIICIENNWHGRTLGAQMMSSNLGQRAWIGYQDADIHHIPFPYPWALNGKSGEAFLAEGLAKLEASGIDLARDVCGFMLETFQGWGAVFYPKDFVQAISRLCKQHSIVLTFDEMQAGFGRTGKAFGYCHYEVEPDLICTGKGMGGGVPLSGVLGRAELMDLPDVGNMSSTHSANPLVCDGSGGDRRTGGPQPGGTGCAAGRPVPGSLAGPAEPLPAAHRPHPGPRHDPGGAVPRPQDRLGRWPVHQQSRRVVHAKGRAGGAHRPRVHQTRPAADHL